MVWMKGVIANVLILCVLNGYFDKCQGYGPVSVRNKRSNLDDRAELMDKIHLLGKVFGGDQRIRAEFQHVYNGSVKQGNAITYVFNYTERANKTTAVRLHVGSSNSKLDFPLQFVVHQQRGVMAWQLPLVLYNLYPYSTVSRTLCPIATDQKHTAMETQEITVGVSTSAANTTKYTLNASLVTDFEIMTHESRKVSVSPSEPKYFQYEFPDGVKSVVMKVESKDSLCMTMSVQETHCPVFDLDRNVEFTGTYQTVTKKGAITLQRESYKNSQVFLVLVVKPQDTDCGGVTTLIPPGISGGKVRVKNMTISVTPSISDSDYIRAVLVAVGCFFLFYLATLIISIICHIRDKRRGDMYPIPESVRANPQTTRTDTGTDTQTPISTGAMGQGTYGAVAGPDFDKASNGIPHRIPPQRSESEVSSINEEDVDMLRDAEEEKEIYRTKTFLHVADLARKDRKKLSKKYRLYHWNLIVIAIFYGLPVIQLVVTYQAVLHVTGNEDICYYNFYCAHPLGELSAFNNVFSNVGYIMLGLLFLILILRRDILHRKAVSENDVLEKEYGIPQHFGLFYAMGIGLAMEGVLSGCYHVCPSYSNFQFDTAFMYMLGWLCMLKIYQTRHPDINAQAHTAYLAIAAVILIAVLGVVYGSTAFWVIFGAIHFLCTLILSVQVYYMGRWKVDFGIFRRLYYMCRYDILACTRPIYMDRFILLILGNAVNWSFAIYGIISQPKDFASYLLAIVIVNLLMYFAFYIIMKLRSGERILLLPMLFIVIAAVLWGASFYFFLAKLTSWQVTPALSREGNKDCILLGFFDDHDIWHCLSSMALFFSFMVLLTLDDDLIYTLRNEIPVF